MSCWKAAATIFGWKLNGRNGWLGGGVGIGVDELMLSGLDIGSGVLACDRRLSKFLELGELITGSNWSGFGVDQFLQGRP